MNRVGFNAVTAASGLSEIALFASTRLCAGRRSRLQFASVVFANSPREFMIETCHCEEPTGPAFGRPDDKLRDEAIQLVARFWIASLRSQ
jgi:hypothetical protein